MINSSWINEFPFAYGFTVRIWGWGQTFDEFNFSLTSECIISLIVEYHLQTNRILGFCVVGVFSWLVWHDGLSLSAIFSKGLLVLWNKKMNPKPPWPLRRLEIVYAINNWMWTIASSLFQRVGFHFHWIRGEKGKRVCEDMKWKKMESDDYQSQYEGCLRFWIEITTKHVISCTGSIWNRQRCNRCILPPDLLSDKRRWITMHDSRTLDHIRPRTTIEQVSESVYHANELGNIVLLLIYYHVQLKNVLVVCFDSDTLLNLV
ncbi:BnaC09g53730D [Brassica napus]|uniref:(rape) hypothetical protein n=1 Tax=Brassica napus TaxID=3708 RepID=A0A078JV13_BRANA|nr:unnamed protein product [Brassica napus]CDY71408.1 BnaC09g53730D [Brassica napus]